MHKIIVDTIDYQISVTQLRAVRGRRRYGNSKETVTKIAHFIWS